MGVRDMVPSQLLRLGRDQEAYDFVKWWVESDDRPNYDWGDTSLPYLDIKDADALKEDPIFTKNGSYKACMIIAITLVKIRLLLEIRSWKDAKIIGKKVPQEIMDNIQQQLVSPVLKNNPMTKEILEDEDEWEDWESDLKNQIQELYVCVHNANQYFWPALIRPGNHLKAHPSAYSMGSVPEMQLHLRYSYKAWAETPGAIDIIKLCEKDELMESGDEQYVGDWET